jgi:hypothetical protein
MTPATSACRPASSVVAMRPPARCRREHHLHERRAHVRLLRRARELVGQRLARLLRREQAFRLHAAQHHALAGDGGVLPAIRVEARWPLGQTREERRLRGRDQGRRHAEVRAAGALGSRDLVAVGRQVQIQGQQLALAEAVLETQGHQRLAQLLGHAARARGLAAVQQVLGHLLRQRRPAFHHASFRKVHARRAKNRHGVDARVTPEPAVLHGNRGGHQHRRQRVGGEPHTARGVGRQRLIQRLAAPVHHERGQSRLVQQSLGQGAHPQPRQQHNGRAGDAEHGRTTRRAREAREPDDHRFTSITLVAVRPKTSGSYISSALAGAVRNVPAVVARTM